MPRMCRSASISYPGHDVRNRAAPTPISVEQPCIDPFGTRGLEQQGGTRMDIVWTNPRRALVLGVAGLIAALALLTALALSGSGTQSASAGTGSMSLSTPVNQRELVLSNA